MTPGSSTHLLGVPNPEFIKTCLKYKALKNTTFLSHHVNCVNNNLITTVRSTKRQDDPQLGDNWVSTKEENTLTTKTSENFTPVPGDKPTYDDTYKAPPAEQGITDSVVTEPDVPKQPEINDPKSNPKLFKLIKFLEFKKYKIYEDIGVLNIVATRNTSGEVTNTFDDDIYVFFKNQNSIWEIYEYKITTLPGLIPGKETLPDRVAMLRLAQYIDQLSMDFWQGDTSHKCLKFKECAIQRNINSKKYDWSSPTEIGRFPIAIHRSSSTSSAEYVFNYSEGSQVFKTITQYEQFIRICENQVKVANKDVFTYTLCSKEEFDENSKVSDEDIKLNKFEKYL
jgi:hypothetical protein